MLENRSFDAVILVADESAIDDIFNHSTTDELVRSDSFNDDPDRSVVGSLDVVFGFSSDEVGRAKLLRKEIVAERRKETK